VQQRGAPRRLLEPDVEPVGPALQAVDQGTGVEVFHRAQAKAGHHAVRLYTPSRSTGTSAAAGARYFRDNVRFGFAEQELAGLTRFYRDASELGLVPAFREPSFCRPTA
jgi:hypothetical protein